MEQDLPENTLRDSILVLTPPPPPPGLCPSSMNLRPNPKENMVYGMGPYAVIDCKLTFCRRQSRLQHIYHGQSQPNARVDLNPVPRSTLSARQGLRILPQGQKKKGSLSHEAN
jgi:hypothetical protein